MTDRPILFSAPMIRALLEGRKTQTRRVLEPQPDSTCSRLFCIGTDTRTGALVYSAQDARGEMAPAFPVGKHSRSSTTPVRFAVGDRLWVRENWRSALSFDDLKPRDLPRTAIAYEADGEKSFDDFAPGKLRSARFMPRWASRLTLVVTGVRVQRLQDISEEDAKAEGILCADLGHGPLYHSGVGRMDVAWTPWAVSAFADLWESVNAKRGFSWEALPWWVVALTFDVHRENIDRFGGQA